MKAQEPNPNKYLKLTLITFLMLIIITVSVVNITIAKIAKENQKTIDKYELVEKRLR